MVWPLACANFSRGQCVHSHLEPGLLRGESRIQDVEPRIHGVESGMQHSSEEKRGEERRGLGAGKEP